MTIAEKMIIAANEYYAEVSKDFHGRFRSWEHCYYTFFEARSTKQVDIDYLSLHLAFYLASWGMYRGSTFLVQKDYKIHIPVVEEILKKKYDVLFGLSCENLLKKENQILLLELVEFISEYYESVRTSVKGEGTKKSVSKTLVTKVLMGTLGCVPAYDRFFIDGIKSTKVATGIFNLNSLLQLARFYQNNQELLEKARYEMLLKDIIYPQMKLIDMGFWQIGFSKDTN